MIQKLLETSEESEHWNQFRESFTYNIWRLISGYTVTSVTTVNA